MQINGFNVMTKVFNQVSHSKEAQQGFADKALEKACAGLSDEEGKALDLFINDAMTALKKKCPKMEPTGMDYLDYRPEMPPILSTSIGGLLDKQI